MAARFIGLALSVFGLCLSLFHERVNKKILKKENCTDRDVIAVKSAGLLFAILGAAVAMLLG